MKVRYRQTARHDLIRQFRYYLVEQDSPRVAFHFREAVQKTIQALRRQPSIAPPYKVDNPRLKTLRSWPVAGFEAIRIYFLLENEDGMQIIRILHSKRDVWSILQHEV